MVQRRNFVAGIASLGIGGGLATGTLSNDVRASVSGGLSISDVRVLTDRGELGELYVSVPDGEARYDGLDTDASAVTVNLYAAPVLSGNTVGEENLIATVTETVADSSSMMRAAGLFEFEFTDVDVFSSASLSADQFRARTDGEAVTTAVEFALEVLVLDFVDIEIVSDVSRTTSTVTVENEAETGRASGGGHLNAAGMNQSPGDDASDWE